MMVDELRNFGVAFSDAEGSWTPELRAEMRKKGMAIVMGSLGGWQKLSFAWEFMMTKRRAARADLSRFRERGVRNETFLRQQMEYLSVFSALAAVLGSDAAVGVMKEVMDQTAKKALLLCLPEAEKMQRFEDPFGAWRDYARASPAAAREAGTQDLRIAEDNRDAFQFDVTWCVWLELARTLGVPEACLPNCYSDDLVFPEYFAALGIRYTRTQTLAGGGACCDFRFVRAKNSEPEVPSSPSEE